MLKLNVQKKTKSQTTSRGVNINGIVEDESQQIEKEAKEEDKQETRG